MNKLINMTIKNIILLLIFVGNSTHGKCVPIISLSSLTDTPKISAPNLQSFIDVRVNEINVYNSLLYRKDKLNDTIEASGKRISELINTEETTKPLLKKICSRLDLNSKNDILMSITIAVQNEN